MNVLKNAHPKHALTRNGLRWANVLGQILGKKFLVAAIIELDGHLVFAPIRCQAELPGYRISRSDDFSSL